MQHLFLVNIGPVQEFIASARRSRDLWFGSWLLSELAKAAAAAIAEREGLEALIFPAPAQGELLEPESDLNVPNQIQAVAQTGPTDLGRAVRAAIFERLHAIRDRAFAQVGGPFDRPAAAAQVDDLVEVYWAAVPLDGDYRAARERLQAVMAARKGTRLFHQPAWGAPVPKSSLDGARESVIPESAYPPPGAGSAERTAAGQRLYRQYGVSVGERLSGVDLLKRHGTSRSRAGFLSTSHVAALPLLDRLAQGDTERARAAWQEYLGVVKGLNVDLDRVPEDAGHPVLGNHDGAALFESRLAETLEGENLRQAQQALRRFLKAAADGDAPLPYYALLHADGDRMGAAISAQGTREGPRRLSQALDRFAGQVRGIVDGHRGALVYAGGDDVLALLPLHTALDCAGELAARFAESLREFEGADGHSPTLSAGLAVCHHLEPLSEALELVREAEKQAKRLPGKSALAVTLSKRSGADRTVVGHWDAIDKRLKEWADLYCQDAVPDGLAFELEELAERLEGDGKEEVDGRLREATLVEAERIIDRKQAAHGARAVDEATRRRLKGALHELAQDERKRPVRQLADELIVARAFADAMQLARVERR